jgi:hypothetical protein
MTTSTILAPLYESTMTCTACFEPASGLHLPLVDLPQPRWVGPGYDGSSPRVLVVMLNPGQGDEPQAAQNQSLKTLLHNYKNRESTYEEVLHFQREHMAIWGRPQGKFIRFYTFGLGVKLDDLSFLNIALCATKENKYPSSMLRRCFARHTQAIAVALRPQIVLLSGSGTHAFAHKLSQCLPQAEIVPTLHYAHREGSKVEADELARVRELMMSRRVV